MAAAKRPVLKIPPTPGERALEGIGIAALVFNLLIVIWSWSSLPVKIPTHFNIAGKVDSYGDKIILFLLPFLGLIQFVGMSVLSHFPHTFNYPWRITPQNAVQQYRLVRQLLALLKTEIVCFLAYTTWLLIQVGLSKTTEVNFLFAPVFVLIVFSTIGIYLWRAYTAR